MMPPYSCAVPGMKPGTSTKVNTGMLNASQKRTKRAALMLLLMSRQPASTSGWFATMPTACAVHAAEADHDVLRVVGLQLEEVAVVDGLDDQLLDVVGLVRVVGHQRVERQVDAGRPGRSTAAIGAFSRLFSGR